MQVDVSGKWDHVFKEQTSNAVVLRWRLFQRSHASFPVVRASRCALFVSTTWSRAALIVGNEAQSTSSSICITSNSSAFLRMPGIVRHREQFTRR